MLEVLLGHPLTLRLGWTLVHSLWQGLALAGLLGLGLLLLGPARIRLANLLASLTLFLWLLAPVVTFLALGTASSSPVTVVALDSSEAGATPEAGEVSSPNVRSAASDRATPTMALPTTAMPVRSGLQFLLPHAALAWLIIASLLSLRLLGGFVLAQRLARMGTPIPALQPRLDALAKRLGVRRRVRLLASPLVDAPTALGWLKPVVLLPASAISGLTRDQLDLILAHELAHIRRYDYLLNILQGLAEALLFYHPLTWWLSRTLRSGREHACDDLALSATASAPLTLAEALTRLETTRSAPAPALSATGNLTHRVRRLLGHPPARTLQPGSVAAALASTMLVTVALSALAQNTTAAGQDDPPLNHTYRWLTIIGEIEFDPDTEAVIALATDASIIVEERTPVGTTKVTLTAGQDGEICYQLQDGDQDSADCGPGMPAWFGEHLSDYHLEKIAEQWPGPSGAGSNGGISFREGISESFFWAGSEALGEAGHDFLPPAGAMHGYPEYQGSSMYQNDVAGTVLRAAHLRAHDILGEGELVEALRERLEHESLTSQGHEVWRQAIFESELPEIRRAIDPLEPALTRIAASQVDQWSVVLDPAHGDGQPGATGPIPEADLTLAVARRARELLEQQGVAVVLTRDDDEALALTLDEDLAARAAFATEEHDAYITLHAATASDSTSRGVEVHISARQREEQRYLDSRNLAEAILQAVTDETGARERGLRESRLPQLELVEIPAVSLDLGFLSNQAEGERLASSEYQDQLARGLANGILAFLAQQQTESAAEHGLITPQELRRGREELSDDGLTKQSREVRSPASLTSELPEIRSMISTSPRF